MQVDVDVIELVKHSVMLVMAYLVAPLNDLNFLLTLALMATVAGGLVALHARELERGRPLFVGGMHVIRLQLYSCPRHQIVHNTAQQMFWFSVPYLLLTLLFSTLPAARSFMMTVSFPVWFLCMAYIPYALYPRLAKHPSDEDSPHADV